MDAKKVEVAVEKALRGHAVSDKNPCGGTGYYDEGEALPFRVLFADGCNCESFATLDGAVDAAGDYAGEMDVVAKHKAKKVARRKRKTGVISRRKYNVLMERANAAARRFTNRKAADIMQRFVSWSISRVKWS